MRLAMVLLAMTLAACGAAPTPQPPTNLGIDNGTNLTVTLVVNGHRIADIAPGTVEPVIPEAALPPLPWTVEVRAPSGWVLGRHLTGDYAANSTSGSEFDLSCGIVRVWTGESELPISDSPSSVPYPCGP